MNKFRYLPCICLFFLLLGFLLVVLQAPSIVAPAEIMDCQTVNFRPMNAKNIICKSRAWIAGTYQSIVIDNGDNRTTSDHHFSFYRGDADIGITGQSIRTPNTVVVSDIRAGSIVGQSSGVGTSWSSATRMTFHLLETEHATYVVSQAPHSGPYEFLVTPNKFANSSRPATVTKYIARFTALILMILSIFIAFTVRSTSSFFLLLSTTFLTATFYCGLPFGSSAGWYDPADDKSYVHWTYNLGFLTDPFLYHTDLKSWAQNNNHHTWGTGLLLAPFVAPLKLLGNDIGTGSLFLSFMSNGVIMLSFAAIVIYFAAFRRIFSISGSILAAVGTLLCTSLLKWTYMRNFFSHAPEAFTLSIVTYGCVGRYFSKDSKRFDLLCIVLGLFFAIQTRRENMLFLVPLLCFELFGTTCTTLSEILKRARRRARAAALLLCTVAASEFVLRLTNYFTDLKHFEGTVAARRLLRLDQPGQMFSKNFFPVFFEQDFGLFYWKNLFAIVPVFAIFVYWRRFRVWLPLVSTVLLFMMLCVFYEMPNGVEWQNRFLLKLNPIFFGALALLMSERRTYWRILGGSTVVISAYFELDLYRRVLPAGMAFYADHFSDNALLYPQAYSGASMYLFFLPLIGLSCASILLTGWIFYKNKTPRTSP